MSTNSLTEEQIRTLLSSLSADQCHCGLDVFVVMKSEPKLNIMSLSENTNHEGKTFRDVLKEMIFSVITDSFLSIDAEYTDGTRLADNQHKFLIINQSGAFTPFLFLNNSNSNTVFAADNLSDVCGLIFKIRKDTNTIWCYQHLWSIMVPNKKKNSLMARLNRFENHTVFEEQSDDLLTISKKIDILIIDGHLITSNITLLQKYFGFQDYI